MPTKKKHPYSNSEISTLYFKNHTYFQNIYIKFSSLTDDRICIGFVYVLKNGESGCMVSKNRLDIVKQLISVRTFNMMFRFEMQKWEENDFDYMYMLMQYEKNYNSHCFYDKPSFIAIDSVEGFKTLFDKHYDSNDSSLYKTSSNIK